jgi:antitoxin HicB
MPKKIRELKATYQMLIQWSEEDSCYLVELPEFFHGLERYFTHGATYDEALSNAQEYGPC